MGGPISKENNWASMNAIYQFKRDMVNDWPKCEALDFNGTERPSWQEILEISIKRQNRHLCKAEQGSWDSGILHTGAEVLR
jgi:hypothetical protein